MKKYFQLFSCFVGAVVLLITLVGPVFGAASVFDWDQNPWPNSPQSFSRVYSNVGNPATTFTYTFSGHNPDMFNPISPVTNITITGGTTDENTLFISYLFRPPVEAITLTTELSSHAINVSFTLMDIDSNGSGATFIQDEVLIIGEGDVSGVVTPTLTAISATHVTVVNNVATSTGTTVDNASSAANVQVDFGLASINRIIIVYRPGPLSDVDSSLGGGIALHDINFTPSTPTAVSLQSFQAQTPNVVTPFLWTGALLAGVTSMWAVQRKRRLIRSMKPLPIDP